MKTQIIWIIDHVATTAEPHSHNFYQMIFCKKKGGEITIGNKTYEAKQDNIYFIKPETNHTIRQKNDMKVIDLKFYVYGDDLNNYLSNTPAEFQLDDISFMKMIFLFIAKEGIDGKTYCNEVTNSALKLILAKIIHKFNESSGSTPQDYQIFFNPPKYTKNNADILILELKNYIEQNIDKPITLDELAARVNFNKTYLVKKFKTLFEVSPIKFVLNMRIEKAKQMIITENLSIQEIAEKVGFNSLHYFSAAFKQSEGLSPTEYYKYFNKR